jgi:hypothetical protein
MEHFSEDSRYPRRDLKQVPSEHVDSSNFSLSKIMANA